TAATGQRPEAIASSAMMEPCEKPTSTTRLSCPRSPCCSMIPRTTSSKAGLAAAMRCGRFASVTPEIPNHCRPGPPPSKANGPSVIANAAVGSDRRQPWASGARSVPRLPTPCRKMTRFLAVVMRGNLFLWPLYCRSKTEIGEVGTVRHAAVGIEGLDRIVAPFDVVDVHRLADAGDVEHTFQVSGEIGILGQAAQVALEQP